MINWYLFYSQYLNYYNLAKQIPAVSYTKNYPQANEDYVNAFTKYTLKGTDAATVLKEASDSIKSKVN